MHKTFSGAGVALITPFRSDLQIDFDSLGHLIDSQIENGMDFLSHLGQRLKPQLYLMQRNSRSLTLL